MPALTPEHRRLLKLARAKEGEHLASARGAVLAQYRKGLLADAQAELERVLALPQAQRRVQLPKVLALISKASAATRTPPEQVYRSIRAAVRDRVLSVDELARISDPGLAFNDSKALQARAVDRQRQEMNGYWNKEQKRFRDDTAKTVREAIRKGLSVEQAAGLLEARVGVSRNRALLVAEDQLLTALATSERARLKALGIQKFIWWSRMDQKVRRGHQLLHGRIFEFKAAPILPGQEIRCRCRAIGVPVSGAS
ncbi:minor capsid protein [Deinococcus sp. HMF7604]|uniref:minor capsid protein n=1 Tax=Deinococcus betulae TaxID=2873312 RepID=UPI001CCAC7E4|nr:minor capsid protein [Deinococcus betulae]MBZ9753190.1 minor capsid protein [Deinococcus betulae]